MRAGTMKSLLDSEVNALRVWIGEEIGDAERIARDPRVREAIVAARRARRRCAGPARAAPRGACCGRCCATSATRPSTCSTREGRLLATRFPDYCGLQR